MEYFQNQTTTNVTSSSFVSTVFLWMGAALGLTALTSYIFGTIPELLQLLINMETGSPTILMWIAIFCPFIIVLVMNFGLNRLSSSALTLVFVAYSILMGISLSTIFLIYELGSIARVFLICALMFGVMAVVGYTTKTDLTKFGKILLLGLIGIIIASIVNFFTNSERLDYFISFIGVIIFTGLTAWDMQRIKQLEENGFVNNEVMSKVTIMAALELYLDFINLFLFLLRLFGQRK